MTPVEIALNLTKTGDGATQAADELQQAHEAALVLGDAALKAEREQARWNQTLEQLSTAGLERLEAQLSEVIAETEKAGGSTTALRTRLDDVKAKLGETGDQVRRTAADYRNLGDSGRTAAAGTASLATQLVRNLAPAAAALKLKGLAMEALAYAEGIKDAGERTGLTAEEVQRLTYAANQNATSFAELEVGLKQLAVTIETDAAKLNALGIATQDATGLTRPLRDILGDLSEVIKNTEDPTRRTSIAVQLLGRSGQQLVPLMSQGRDALKEFGDEAARTGRVIDDATIAKLDEAKQSLENLQQRVTIFSGNVAAEFMAVGDGMGMIAADLVNIFDGLPPALADAATAAQGASATATQAHAAMRAEIERNIAVLAAYKRAQQEAYETETGNAANEVLKRANEKLAAEEEAQRTPEQKAERARAARQAQFDQEVQYFDRSPDPSARSQGRSILERERDIDLAKIDADAKAERARLDAEAERQAIAAEQARQSAAGAGLGARAAEGVGIARTTAAARQNPDVARALDAAERAAQAAQDGGSTEAEITALVEALAQLSGIVSELGGESPALKTLLREVTQLKTQMQGLIARANTK